jgi:phosphate transport system protein
MTDVSSERRHTDQGYDQDLQTIRERLLTMAGRVERMIAEAVRALMEDDGALAQATIDADARVDHDEVEIDGLCLTLLACRQPMASDLRFVTFTLKMVTDLERIGDLAVNVCERVRILCTQPRLAPYVVIPIMGERVSGMVSGAIDAFVGRDAAAAQQVIARDDEVDELYHQMIRKLFELMRQDPGNIERGIHVQAVGKYLERMGDHATNLAEQVVFMLRGEDIRHRP